MAGPGRWRLAVALAVGLGVGVLATLWLGPHRRPPAAAPAPPREAAPLTVAARAAQFTPRYSAYAEVVPVHDLTVRSPVVGTLTALGVQPGDAVAQGARLGTVGGPRHAAAVKGARAKVAGDQTELALDLRLARASAHLVASGLSTLTGRATAEARVARARSALAADQATLAALAAGAVLRAPSAGTVVAVHRAAGETVAPGTPVVTLEPAGHLQLRGRYYGADASALAPGMTGVFHPADGSAPVPVVARRRVPPLRPDGARVVTCAPARSPAGPGWQSGEAGRLVLEGKAAPAVAVPTAALVLDRGHFYVLVHDAHGDHPQAVQPLARRGPDTLVHGALTPGARVVARDADLRYHRAFSGQYLPPD